METFPSDSDSSPRPRTGLGRVGLSDYTSKRLEELRARREECDYEYYKGKAHDSPKDSPKDSPTRTPETTRLESYRTRRTTPADTTVTTPAKTDDVGRATAAVSTVENDARRGAAGAEETLRPAAALRQTSCKSDDGARPVSRQNSSRADDTPKTAAANRPTSFGKTDSSKKVNDVVRKFSAAGRSQPAADSSGSRRATADSRSSPTRETRPSPTRETRPSPTRETQPSPTRETRPSPTRETGPSPTRGTTAASLDTPTRPWQSKKTTENKEYLDVYRARPGNADTTNLGSSPACTAPKSANNNVEEEFVGFSSLPEQVHRKAVRRGFDFTLMVVGESGLGKSTLISSLFLNPEMYNGRKIPPVHERITKTVQIEKKNMEIEEKGIRLRLTIVDTPGFNEALKGDESWRQIEGFVDQQFDHYFRDESGVNRKHINDTRVHCCLYFISPFGHGLRPIDIRFMKQLHTKVNIVPIIAKADTVTKSELHRLKSKLLDQIEENNIHIYEFPDCASDEDEEFKEQDKELKASFPFAVVGSNTVVEVNGQKVRGRLYPWGIVEVDNPDHCDFIKLRQMLISTHMQDLKDVTRDVHYENYRAKYITEHIMKNQRDRNKLKRDSSPNFDNIVYADTLLQVKEDEIRHMQEMLLKMQCELNKARPQANGHHV